MQVLIGCAKTMNADVRTEVSLHTEPHFLKSAESLASDLAEYSADELQGMLGVNSCIANENWKRYQHFFDKGRRVAAALGYDGMVFRKLNAGSMGAEEQAYANEHLLIASFLYGLLRPFDEVNCYRLEGNVVLGSTGGETLFRYWRERLTDWFIERIQSDDGVLVNLASSEFKGMFDWKRVSREVDVITPEFRVERGGRLRTVVIYAKMCRGAMARYIMDHHPSTVDMLRGFEYEGFRYEADWQYNLRVEA